MNTDEDRAKRNSSTTARFTVLKILGREILSERTSARETLKTIGGDEIYNRFQKTKFTKESFLKKNQEFMPLFR